MSDRLQKLLETVSDQDKIELNLAQHGRNQTMIAYRDRPGKDTRADMEAAREQLQDTIDRLWRAYFPEDANKCGGEWYRNETEAYNDIVSMGYEVSRGKFNGDKKAGKMTVSGKRISKWSVLQYAMSLKQDKRLVKDNSGDMAAMRDKDEARKIKAEADIKEMQAETARRELDRDWIHRDEAWAQLAALVGTLRDSIRHHVHVAQGHIIHLAGGDPTRGPEVYEGVEEILARAFNEVLSSGRIEAVFEEIKEEEDAA